MATFYDRISNSATRLITTYGQKIRIEKIRKQEGSPQNRRLSGTPEYLEVDAVLLPGNRDQTVSTTTVPTKLVSFIISAVVQELAVLLRPNTRIIDSSGNQYDIDSVTTTSPSGRPIVYVVSANRLGVN